MIAVRNDYSCTSECRGDTNRGNDKVSKAENSVQLANVLIIETYRNQCDRDVMC